MVEELDEEHAFNCLVGKFHFTIDWLGIATSVFNNKLMVKIEWHEICQLRKLTTLTHTEDGALVSMVKGELNEGLEDLE